MTTQGIKLINPQDDINFLIQSFLMHLGAFNRECLPVERYSSTLKQLSYVYPKPGEKFMVTPEYVIRLMTTSLDEIYYVIEGINETRKFLCAKNNIYRVNVRCDEVKDTLKNIDDQMCFLQNFTVTLYQLQAAVVLMECFRSILAHRRLLTEELNDLPFSVRFCHRKYLDVLKHGMCFGGSYR